MLDIGIPEEAQKFHDYYTSNGWKVGGKGKMVDWKGSARSWKSRCETFQTVTWEPPTKEEVFAYAARQRWPTRFAKQCWHMFVARGWKHYGDPITSDERWQSIMRDTECKT
jgi:hypothetical protein